MELALINKPMKRVYYFTPPEHALENLKNGRLKVSRFSKCNDAFELAAFDLSDKKLRKRFDAWLTVMDSTRGLLCFCRSWRNPVLWGHYARNHTGLCCGFDVDPEKFIDVRYVSQRLYPGVTLDTFLNQVGEEQTVELFATKFIHWHYEEEVRLLVEFSSVTPPNDIIFHAFSEEMILKEVIVGPRSELRVKDVRELVTDNGVDVFQSRLAFKSFSVVRQKNRTMW